MLSFKPVVFYFKRGDHRIDFLGRLVLESVVDRLLLLKFKPEVFELFGKFITRFLRGICDLGRGISLPLPALWEAPCS